ncbi:MAG: RNA polymerase sporulation sigma factor SigH [Ruminococcaceae bacterium]|nr:RNA polymerase sporulation sigma factor SigH [Oscillospiraceae bacterium]
MQKDVRPEAPESLTDEKLVLLSQEGDDAAMEHLLSKYRTLVRRKARTYFLIGADREDLVQEGMIGLFKAVRDYREDRQSGFRAFAELCITRQIITAVKMATRQKHEPLNTYVSLNRPLGFEEYELTLLDVVSQEEKEGDPETILLHRERFSDIGNRLSSLLSTFERKVLVLYIRGKSYQEIGLALGKEPKSIDNALQRIKHKIEKYVEWYPQ